MPEPTPSAGSNGEARREPRPAPVDILLVDDHPAKITALEAALAPLGQNLVCVTSGRDALRQLLTHSFATVVLDVNMPGMDGFETAQLIRGRPRSAHTPIIFVSSVNLAEADALRGYSLGAVDYILAPIVPEILRAKVSVFVDLHRKTQEARLRAAELEARTQELQESQQQLQMAERLAALGTLSAGLGHDMGNALLPIQAQLEGLDLAGVSLPVREALENVRSCTAYLRRLAQGLRALSQSPDSTDSVEQATEIAGWWEDIEPMLRNALPQGLAFKTAIEPGLPPLRLARHLLSQLAFNLVQNAGDALRERGRGTVTLSISADAMGGRVTLTVSDDGPGMSPEVQARCFEPFFSTKSRTRSTGLGLALVHGIVQRAGGEIAVLSEPGQGATFRCSFMAATLPAAGTAGGVAAYIDVPDARWRSVIASILSARGVAIVQSEDRDRAEVWVCDSEGSSAAEAAGWMSATPARRVLLLGSPAQDRGSGIPIVDPRAGMGEIRRALRSLLAVDPDASRAKSDPIAEIATGGTA